MSIEVSGLDELLKQLTELSDESRINEIAKHAVDAAQPLSEAAMRDAISAVEKGPYSTGSISASISSTKAEVNAYGVFAVARPTGRDSKGTRNGEKAAYLQYGTSRMDARPWRESAVARASNSCSSVMEDVIRREMNLE